VGRYQLLASIDWTN